MGEKNLWSKVGLITLLVGLSLWQIMPFSTDQLKPGIDLGGGYSALFEIDDTGAESDPQLAEKVMEVLKRRIDPGSTRNLIWRPIGRNRLEIQMPSRPGAGDIRDKYEALRQKLMGSNLTEAQVRAALSLPPAQRDAKLKELELNVDARKAAFAALSTADDLYRRLASAAQSQPAAETQPASQPTTRPGEELGAAIEARAARISDVLKTNLNVQPLLDVLELSQENKLRGETIEKAKKENPKLAADIDELVTLHDKWSQRRGTLEDPSDLLRMLKGAGVLEFRILATRESVNPDALTSPKPEYNQRVAPYIEALEKRGPRPETGDVYAWFKVSKPQENSIMSAQDYYVVANYLGTPYVLAHATNDMGLLKGQDWSLVAAHPDRDSAGRLAVAFQLDPRGGDKFSTLTSMNLNRPLCIFLDNEAISAANIRSAISTHGQISGSFSQKDVSYLVQTLEAGALPARLKEVPIQERNVGPSLGTTNRAKGMTAVIVSLVAVIAFMIIYYAYNGAIADVALLLNLIITLGAMSFLQATFTLPGIAGLILTVGMAVDANVLIFERMREELQRGVSARMAVKLGYERAFSAIFDGNLTTIITAAILYWIGSEEIKGFGLTLALGLAISMFTALFVTRQYYYVMIPQTLNRDETRKAWTLPAILVILAAFLMAAGMAISRDWHSNGVQLGKFFGTMGLTAAVILASMWGFRALYKASGHQRANRLPMMKLMAAPNFDWLSRYKKFWAGSAIVILIGMLFLSFKKPKDIMDIEFIGGTNVQIELTDKNINDAQLKEYISGKQQPTAVSWLNNAAELLKKAEVKADGEGRFIVTVPPGTLAFSQLQALLSAPINNGEDRTIPALARNGITPVANGVAVQFKSKATEKDLPPPDLATAQRLFKDDASAYAKEAANRLADMRIQGVTEGGRQAFDLITTETARTLVAEALTASSLRDKLVTKQVINATLVTNPDRAPNGFFPVTRDDSTLGDVTGDSSREDISRFKGGLVMIFDNLQPPVTTDEVTNRIKQMRMQPDFEDVGQRTTQVLPLEPAGSNDANGKPLYKKLAVAVVDENHIYVKNGSNETWETTVANREKALATAALGSSQSLQRVTTFLPQVASEGAQKAIIAVILSFIAIAGYLWVRFGSLDFGISGIIALYHDVAIALTAIVFCHYISGTWLARLLMLEDFKIDLNIIAALLTIVGYSINDTIVIFDRIRENRGRLGQISPTLVNDSLNQTLSRTVLTAFTVFMVVLIMYFFGGQGIHGFAFAMIIGSISGTYSTLAIATPMVMHPRAMWVTTIGITALTMFGLTWHIENPALRAILILIVVGAAVYGAYRQFNKPTEEELAKASR